MVNLILLQVESYFDQAFVKEDEIGAGDFGRVFRVRSRVSLKHSFWKICCFSELLSRYPSVPRWIKRCMQ